MGDRTLPSLPTLAGWCAMSSDHERTEDSVELDPDYPTHEGHPEDQDD